MSDNVEIGSIVDEFYEEQDDGENESDERKSIDSVIPTEPAFTYTRLEHGFDAIVGTDSVCCLAVHQKFIALGTDLGRVHFLDHIGNQIEQGLHAVHSRRINQISISEAGDFIASCSDDGMVIVYNLCATESERVARMVCQLNHPVKSIAIEPNYSKSPNMVLGFDKLFLVSPGALNRFKRTTLVEGRGPIRNLRWRRSLILWVDDECVNVYDFHSRRLITHIQHREDRVSPVRRALPCFIGWLTDTNFAIGRGQLVHVCEVIAYTDHAIQSVPGSRRRSLRSSLSSLTSDSENSSSLTSSISDLRSRLVSWSVQGQLLVASEQSRVNGSPLLQLMLVEITDTDYMVITSRERVPLDDLSSSAPSGLPTAPATRRVFFSLESIPGENAHYLVSAKRLICATELSPDDHIDWLVEQDQHLSALHVARSHKSSLYKHSVQSIGLAYINRLLQDKQFSSAAELLPQVLKPDKAVWEEQIVKFSHLGQLQVLAPHIPTSNGSFQLESRVYEAVLIDLMKECPDYFCQLLQTWGKQGLIDNYDALLSSLVDLLKPLSDFSDAGGPGLLLTNGYRALSLGLAQVYTLTGSTAKAVELLVALGNPAALDLVNNSGPTLRRQMINEVLRERVLDFMQLDVDRTVALLLDNVEEISTSYVVNQLQCHPHFLYQYLDRVYCRLPQLVTPHLLQLVELYIRFDRDRLLSLLQSTDCYSLQTTLKLCQQAHLVKETVYLLTRVGRHRDALRLILTEGGDLDAVGAQPTGDEESEEQQRQARAAAAAIAYCREQDVFVRQRRRTLSSEPYDGVGGELWQQVVLYAVDKPAFVRTLLQHAGAEGLDARLLLRKLSPDMHIPGLKESLVKLLSNHRVGVWKLGTL